MRSDFGLGRPNRPNGYGIRLRAALCVIGALWAALGCAVHATDEIQVYNAGIAEEGQFTIQQHLNYIPLGVKDPPFPGGLISHNSINGTPEFAYGVTDWWEVGLYLPFSIKDQKFYSDSFKLRTLFVSPHAEQRDFFYGVHFEFSNETPPFAQTRFAMEIRPIVGVRNATYELIVNPIVDIGFGKYGEADFAPAARVARKFDTDLYAGFEYYADFGRIGDFKPLAEQQHTLFAVTDFKLGVFDVNFGVGYGLTVSIRPLGRQDNHRLRLSGTGHPCEQSFRCRADESDSTFFTAHFPTLSSVGATRPGRNCFVSPSWSRG